MRKKGLIPILLGLACIAAALVLMMHNRLEQQHAEAASSETMEVLRQEIIPAETADEAVVSYDTEPASAEGSEETKKEIKPNNKDIVYPDYILDPNRAMPEIEIGGYRYIGYLEVPSLGIDQPVQSEWSYPNLQVSACRYAGSVYQNNMVVCGHNYFPGFGLLLNVTAGDLVRFTDVDGNVFDYEIAGVELLAPEDTEEMTESGWDLTLFTCTMSTASRVTVRCRAADPKKTAAKP